MAGRSRTPGHRDPRLESMEPRTMPKQSPSVRREQEDRDEALKIYRLERVLGLREHYAAQHSAFSQLEDDAYARHSDRTPDDVAKAEAAAAAVPYRKRT